MSNDLLREHIEQSGYCCSFLRPKRRYSPRIPEPHNSCKLIFNEMSNTKRLSTVSANIKKKRLYIAIQGTVSKKDAERIYTDIRFCVSDLEPGFTVITDLSQGRIGHLSAIGTFKKITDFLTEKQVGQVVRIVGKAKVIHLQLLKLSDKIQGYKPQNVTTREEAEAFLDNLENKKTLG